MKNAIEGERLKTIVNVLSGCSDLPWVLDCLRDIRDGCPVFVGAEPPVSSRQIRQIYSVRAGHVRRHQYPIHGIDELVASLAATHHRLVQIHAVEGPVYHYTIFTDDNLEELLGIIAIDESTDWRGWPCTHRANWPEEDTPWDRF